MLVFRCKRRTVSYIIWHTGCSIPKSIIVTVWIVYVIVKCYTTTIACSRSWNWCDNYIIISYICLGEIILKTGSLLLTVKSCLICAICNISVNISQIIKHNLHVVSIVWVQLALRDLIICCECESTAICWWKWFT